MSKIFVPGLREVVDGSLWHAVTIPFGDYRGTQTFFNGAPGADDTNIWNSSLPRGKEFRMKKLSLMPAMDAHSDDVNTLISNSQFRFESANRIYYEGPAQTFFRGASSDINEILASLKKMPKKTQQAILQNLKIPTGMELTTEFSLVELQCFRALLITPNNIKLKKPVKITCLLEGKIIRNLPS